MPTKIVTYDQLKTVVNQLVRTGKDAVVKDLAASSVNANTVVSGCYASTGLAPSGYSSMFYLLPNASLPEGHSFSDPNYGGRILTTRNRAYDVVVVSQNSVPDEVEDVELLTGAYYQITGFKFNITTPGITLVSSVTQEYWIMLSIPSSAEPDDIDITFNNQYLVWANGTPNWDTYIGNTVQIHIIGNLATITSFVTSPDIVQPDVTSGTLQEAVAYAELPQNEGRSYQWILVNEDGAETVVKPLWHLGSGYFVDALGYVVADGTGNTNGGVVS